MIPLKNNENTVVFKFLTILVAYNYVLDNGTQCVCRTATRLFNRYKIIISFKSFKHFYTAESSLMEEKGNILIRCFFCFHTVSFKSSKKEMNIDTGCIFLNWYGISHRR